MPPQQSSQGRDLGKYWIEVSRDQLEILHSRGMYTELEVAERASVVRIPRLNFDARIPGTLNNRIARGEARPEDYRGP